MAPHSRCPMMYDERVEQDLVREHCAAYEAADAIESLQQTVEQMKSTVVVEAQHTEMFDERMKTELEIDYHDVTRRDSSDSVSEAINRRYALLPAWIMTFHQGGKPYNIMVNGQTGKVSCAVPFLKAKAMLLYVLMLLLFCIPLGLYGRYALLPIFNAVAHFSDRVAIGTLLLFFGGRFGHVPRRRLAQGVFGVVFVYPEFGGQL